MMCRYGCICVLFRIFVSLCYSNCGVVSTCYGYVSLVEVSGMYEVYMLKSVECQF